MADPLIDQLRAGGLDKAKGRAEDHQEAIRQVAGALRRAGRASAPQPARSGAWASATARVPSHKTALTRSGALGSDAPAIWPAQTVASDGAFSSNCMTRRVPVLLGTGAGVKV